MRNSMLKSQEIIIMLNYTIYFKAYLNCLKNTS